MGRFRLQPPAICFHSGLIPAGLEHAVHLGQGGCKVGDGAQGEGQQHAVGAVVVQGDLFAGKVQPLHVDGGAREVLLRSLAHSFRRLQSPDMADPAEVVVGQIQARAHAHFEHSAFGQGNHFLALFADRASAAGEVDQVGKNGSIIETHTSLLRRPRGADTQASPDDTRGLLG